MFIVFGVTGTITLVVRGAPGVMFIIPAAVAFFNWFGKWSEASKLINSLEEDGALGDVLADFSNGERFLGGRLIRGENYIMTKGSGTVLPLSEIGRIYDIRKSNGFAGDTRILRADTTDGRTYDLMFLSSSGKNDEDVEKLVKTMVL